MTSLSKLQNVQPLRSNLSDKREQNVSFKSHHDYCEKSYSNENIAVATTIGAAAGYLGLDPAIKSYIGSKGDKLVKQVNEESKIAKEILLNELDPEFLNNWIKNGKFFDDRFEFAENSLKNSKGKKFIPEELVNQSQKMINEYKEISTSALEKIKKEKGAREAQKKLSIGLSNMLEASNEFINENYEPFKKEVLNLIKLPIKVKIAAAVTTGLIAAGIYSISNAIFNSDYKTSHK